MPRLTAASVDTYYQKIGHGSTIVLLHGWRNSWQSWAPLIPELAKKYQLLIPDLPGFGKSSDPDPFFLNNKSHQVHSHNSQVSLSTQNTLNTENGHNSQNNLSQINPHSNTSTSQQKNLGWTTDQFSIWLEQFLIQAKVSDLHAVIGHSYGAKIAAWTWIKSKTHHNKNFNESNHNDEAHQVSPGSQVSPSFPSSPDGDLENLTSNLKFPKIPPPPQHGLFFIGPSGIPQPLSVSKKVLKTILPFLPHPLKRKALAPLRPWLYRKLDTDSDYLRSTAFQEATLQKILSEDVRQEVSTKSAVELHLCFGQYDRITPSWMGYHWLKLVQSGEVFIVPEARHHPQQTHPKAVINWLETYL